MQVIIITLVTHSYSYPILSPVKSLVECSRDVCFSIGCPMNSCSSTKTKAKLLLLALQKYLWKYHSVSVWAFSLSLTVLTVPESHHQHNKNCLLSSQNRRLLATGWCRRAFISCRVQLIQNTAARVLTRKKKCDHITPLLRSLHWLPVQHYDWTLLKDHYSVFAGFNHAYIFADRFSMQAILFYSFFNVFSNPSRKPLISSCFSQWYENQVADSPRLQ